jgi:competence protein ComEC
MRAWLEEQAGLQADRWTLWTPVAFGIGSALYFVLRREPQVWVAWACALAALALLAGAAWSHRRALTLVLVLSACVIGGFAMRKIRTERVKAPVAPAGAAPQRLEGWVVDVAAPGQGGQRLLIAPARIGDWAPGATPIRVRVTLRPGAPIPAPGQSRRLRLRPRRLLRERRWRGIHPGAADHLEYGPAAAVAPAADPAG